MNKNLKTFAITIFIIVLALSLVGCNRGLGEVISLTDQNIELFIGQERTITTTIEEDELQWNSSDPGVATVSKGLIKAIYEGEAIITISMDGEKLAKIHVTVVKPEPMSIEIIGEDNMYIHDTISLDIKVKPAEANYPVIWRSSDKDIAEVSEDGVVTSKTFGTVRIYADIHNLSAYKEIIVLKDDPTEIEIVGDSIVTLEDVHQYSILPTHEDASPDVIWTSSKEEIATITNDGILHPHKEGKITLTAVSVRSDEVRDSLEVEIYGKASSVEYSIPTEFIVGGFTTLEYTLICEDEELTLDQNNVVLESSNIEIITIDDEGNINALTTGTATIIVSAKFYPDVKLETTITVLETVSTENIIIIPDYGENESFIYEDEVYIKGHNAFDSINEAIDNTDGSSTITLLPASYNEDLVINKDDITITANDDALFTSSIKVEANNFTLENINFIDEACIFSENSVKGFRFLNNTIDVKGNNDVLIDFICFYSKANNNEDFIIENNQFTGEAINSFITIMNAKDLQLSNNDFASLTGKAIYLTGSTGSNSLGAGANGDIEIHDNEFSNLADGAMVIARYSDANIDIYNNTLTNIENRPLYFEVGVGEFIVVNIYNNQFNDIKAEIGIEFIYSNVPLEAIDVKIHYNRFLSFSHDEFKYINFENETNIIGYAQYNYYDVSANDSNTKNADYENQYESIDDLEAGIKEYEENLDE